MEDLSSVTESVESAPPPPVNPEPLWPEKELARKKTLMAQPYLGPTFQRAIRCAECILARPTFENETPGFTLKEIETCTGLRSATIFKQFEKGVSDGLFEKDQVPSTFLYSSSTRPRIYTPIVYEYSPGLLIPQTKPGCERTTGQLALESITPQQATILSSLAKFLAEPDRATQPLVQAQVRALNPAMTVDAIADMFRTLHRTELIEVLQKGRVGKATVYAATKRGLWLLRQIYPEIEPAAYDDLSPSLLEKVQINYPASEHKLVYDNIVRHLNLRIFHGGVRSPHRRGFKDTGDETLAFTASALASLGHEGVYAIAYYLKLQPIISGRPWTHLEMKRFLGLPSNVNLREFIETEYYMPLLQDIDKQR